MYDTTTWGHEILYYVITPIHDFDKVIYKIRSIDFDQQSFEGDLKVYRPQFFENLKMVELVRIV